MISNAPNLHYEPCHLSLNPGAPFLYIGCPQPRNNSSYRRRVEIDKSPRNSLPRRRSAGAIDSSRKGDREGRTAQWTRKPAQGECRRRGRCIILKEAGEEVERVPIQGI